MRNVAIENGVDVEPDLIRVTAAHGLLDWGSKQPRYFLAFQTALFYLIMASRFEEAAATQSIALQALISVPIAYERP